MTVYPSTYCQIIQPVTFQDEYPTLSPTASSVGGAGPYPLASSGAAGATPELTHKAAAATQYATPAALKGGNHILNIALPTWLWDQELPGKTNSEFTLADSFGVDNNNSTYLESRDNFPVIVNNTPDISAIVKETGNNLEVFIKVLEDIDTPRVIFDKDNNLDPKYIL